MSVTDRGHLSIGEVLSLLQTEFPDVTISKIRFLESQGLIDPERTPSGYRKFYDVDITRLRWILVQQRDHFLPLKVIKDRLDEAAALELPLDGLAGSPSAAPIEPSAPVPPAEAAVNDAADAAIGNGTSDGVEVAGQGVAPGDHRQAAADVSSSPEATTPLVASLSAADAPGPTRPAASRAPMFNVFSGPPRRTIVEGDHGDGTDDTTTGDTTVDDTTAGRTSEDDAARREPEHADGERADGAQGKDHAGDGGLAAHAGAADAHADAVVDGVEANARAEGEQEHAGSNERALDAGSRLVSGDPGGGRTGRRAGPRDGRQSAADRGSAERGEPGSTEPAGKRSERLPGAGSSTGQSTRRRRPDRGNPFGDVSSVSFTVEELAAAVGLEAADIEELERFGLVSPRSVSQGRRYGDDALLVAKLAARFASYGIEARHLRMFKVAVDRELALYEQVVTPVARARGDGAEVRAAQLWADLDQLGADLRDALFHRGPS